MSAEWHISPVGSLSDMSAPFKCLGPSQMALDTLVSKAESNTPLQQIIFLWDLDKCFKLNTASGYSEYGTYSLESMQ